MKQQGKLKYETTGKQKGRCISISIYIASLVMLCYWIKYWIQSFICFAFSENWFHISFVN